jgi:hypothetical protein
VHQQAIYKARQAARLGRRQLDHHGSSLLVSIDQGAYRDADVVKGRPGAGAGDRRRGGPVLADGGAPGLLQRPPPLERRRLPAVGGGGEASRRGRGHRSQAVLHACKVPKTLICSSIDRSLL